MEIMYNPKRMELYEKRAKAGKRLACRAEVVADMSRKQGRPLRVTSFPQGGKHVPSVRVAGKWLERFGFELGDEVILTAAKGRILIKRKDGNGYGSPMV